MTTPRLFRNLLIGATALAGLMQMSSVYAALPASVDASDVQRFEQTYEEWVQSLIYSIAPNIPTTVLIDIDYSNNPEELQNYEELKAANHLPGLPNMVDPNFNHPSESPLYALIAKQNVKVILESEPNANQQKIISEVLNAKLKLNLDRGDALKIESINTVASIVSAAKTETKKSNSTPIHISRETGFAMIALGLFGIVAIAARKLTTKKEQATEIEYIRVVPTETSVSQKLMRKHPRLFARTSLIVNPLNIVLKANPKVLVSVVRNENTLNLARATLHAPEMFTGILLNICSQDQKNQIRAAWNLERNSVSPDQSRFAQVLLAAKIYKELKKSAPQALGSVIGEFTDANHARRALREQMNLSLKVLKANSGQKANRREISEANL